MILGTRISERKDTKLECELRGNKSQQVAWALENHANKYHRLTRTLPEREVGNQGILRLVTEEVLKGNRKWDPARRKNCWPLIDGGSCLSSLRKESREAQP